MRSPSTPDGGRGTGRSIAGRMAIVGLPVLVLLLVFDAVTSYRDAREAIFAAQDRSLRAVASLIAATPVERGRIGALLTDSLAAEPGTVHFALLDHAGITLAGDTDLPYARPDANEPLRLRNGHHRGEPVRVAALLLPPASAAVHGPEAAVLVVAETTAVRHEGIYGLFWNEAHRHLLAALAASILAWSWLAAVRRDLEAPARSLAERAAEDLTPVMTDDLPREVRPLVEAVNDHLSRLAGLIEASRRFAADVAHQLRTPLTLLGAQAQYGLRQDEPAAMRATIDGIATASRAAQRLCNQMLTLSRIEAVRGEIKDAVRVDLAALLRETALDLSVLALEKRIDLGYEDGGERVLVLGNEIMLHELVSNLIDNALRYTPREGRVHIRLSTAEGVAEVAVVDSGPGIEPERREAVFQRFHRRLDRPGGSGSGLGLAIAHQIALVHRGSIAFVDEEGGFAVRVRLPMLDEPESEPAKGS